MRRVFGGKRTGRRSRVHHYIANFAHLFGIRPWEMDLLTVEQFEALAHVVDDYLAERG